MHSVRPPRLVALRRALAGLAAACLSALLAPAQTALTVNWRADRKLNDAQTYQINTWDAVNPATAANASYQTALTDWNLGMVRLHGYEMYSTTNTAKQWVNHATQTWDAAKIAQVLTALRPKTGEVMLSIPNWPAWMDANNDGKLDDGAAAGSPDRRQDYANWCAQLVQIVNVTNNFQVKYWEPLNEKEGSYDWGNAAYADIFNRCAIAMKAVDPTILVGGPALTQPWPSAAQETALKSWIAATKDQLGFFSYHHYGTGSYNPSSDSVYDRATTLGARATWVRGLLNSQGVAGSVPIFLGETNIFFNWQLDQTTGYMRSILGGNYVALAIKSIGETPDARAVQFFNDRDGTYGFLRGDSTYARRATSHVLQLANQHLVGTSVGVTTADAGALQLYAVKSAGKKAVLLVNTSDIALSTGPGLLAGVNHTASITFAENWAPTNSTYTIHTIAETSADTASLSSTTATYSGGALSVSVPSRQIKLLVFTDLANPDRIVRLPEADAHVSSAATTTNYGSANRLNVYGYGTESFVRFDLSNLGGSVASAKIRLFPRTVNGAATHRLDQAASNSWTETGLTYANRPGVIGSQLGSWTPALNAIHEIDVTALAQTVAASADKKLSLRIASATVGADIRYGSKEDLAEFRPELVLVRNAAPVALTPSADGYVSQAAPTTNYATSNVLQVKLTGSGSDVEGYLKFNLAGLSSASSATLYLWAFSIDSTNRVNWLGLAPASWTETGLTWNNRPGSTSDLASWTPVTGQDVVVNVTSAVQAALAAGQTEIAFRVYSKIAGGYNRYGTKEQTTAANRPELLIQP